MIIIISIIKLLAILCIVATVHEFGHFIMAKIFKIGVSEFSIGFGPKIYQKKYKETIYSLRWIPLGGFVMIDGEGEQSDKPNSFAKKHTIQKVLVLSMGVIFNIVLAFIILIGISFNYPTYTTQIMRLEGNSPLIKAGLLTGDRITKLNGKNVSLAEELLDSRNSSQKITKLEYTRDNNIYEVTLDNAVREIGVVGAQFSSSDTKSSNTIEVVMPGKALDNAGIKAGDVITSVNTIKTDTSLEVINIVRQNPNKEISITVNRNGEVFSKKVTPNISTNFDLGISDTNQAKTNLTYAFKKSVYIIAKTASSYVELFRGKVGINDVSSIVGIGVVVSKTNGIIEYLNMLAIISLAIGLANILPFPPLDGGKALFVMIEGIIRRKIPLKFEAIVSYTGFGLLILLTIVVTLRDIIRIF